MVFGLRALQRGNRGRHVSPLYRLSSPKPNKTACRARAFPAGTLPANATPGATVVAGGAPSASSGRIFFSTYSADFSRWNLYRLLVQSGPAAGIYRRSGYHRPTSAHLATLPSPAVTHDDQSGLVVLSTGGDRSRLTTYFTDSHPSWSGDGSQVTFKSDREGDRRWRIYRVGAGGGDSVFLDYGRWPAWSPAARQIAYQSCDQGGGRCGLFLIGADGFEPPGYHWGAWRYHAGLVAGWQPPRLRLRRPRR